MVRMAAPSATLRLLVTRLANLGRPSRVSTSTVSILEVGRRIMDEAPPRALRRHSVVAKLLMLPETGRSVLVAGEGVGIKGNR